MDPEAQVLETAAEVNPEVIPDAPTSPETPLEKTPEGNVPPDNSPEGKEDLPTPDVAQAALEAQVSQYQDILAKNDKNSNYQMTDEETDIFISIQEQIANGLIEEPGLPSGDKPQEKPADGEDKPVEDDEGGDSPEVDIDGMSGDNSTLLQEAMTKIGAKDISEIGSKIDGLLAAMKTSGGKLGTELKEVKTREARHIAWLDDLRAGKPEAMEFLEKSILGKPLTQVAPLEGGKPLDAPDGNYDEYLDDKLAPIVLGLKKQVEAQNSIIDELRNKDTARDADVSRNSAVGGYISDIVDLVTDPKHKSDFTISAKEAKVLGERYWGPNGHKEAVHPKFQQMHELIKFAHERSLPDLKSAHIVWQSENGAYAQKLIEAQRTGEKIAKYKPSANAALSSQQSRVKSNVPSPQIDEAAVARMERGEFNDIPDEWMDGDGNLIKSKIPERFHAMAFPE